MLKSELPGQAKLGLLLDLDRVMGLDLDKVPEKYQVPAPVFNFAGPAAGVAGTGRIRHRGHTSGGRNVPGFWVGDMGDQSRIRPKTPLEQQLDRWPVVSSSREVESVLQAEPEYAFTFVLNAYNYADDVAPVRQQPCWRFPRAGTPRLWWWTTGLPTGRRVAGGMPAPA